MSKFGLLLPNGAPRSLVSPRQEDVTNNGLRSRREGPSFDEILAGRLPAGQVRMTDEAKGALKLHNLSLSALDLDELAGAIDRFDEHLHIGNLTVDEGKTGFDSAWQT